MVRTNERGMDRTSERGMAMIVALFMVLVTSVVGATIMSVSQTETISSQHYRLMSQARYGAESGVHRAANYLLNGYTAPSTVGELANYVATTSPVTYDGQPVVLSTDPAVASNYPDGAIKTAFGAAALGQFNLNDAKVNYKAVATLKSMRVIADLMSNAPVTLQTWEIRGTGTIAGAHTATVVVSSVLERQSTPIYPYAAFATFNGCAALSFAGGATTNSYNSTAAPGGNGKPVLADTFGNVGTNGNLTEVGNGTTINGSLSTPRSGVGNCTANNVTAETISGNATVSDGLNQLSQEIKFPTPTIPAPGSGSIDFKKTGGCGGVPGCADSADGVTIHPATSSTNVQLGDVNINANAIVHLGAGIYNVNSFTMNGNSKIVIDSGPVIINVKGQDQATPLSITGGGISNTTYKPESLQFRYAGTGDIKLAGGDETSALIYAPNASATINGGADLYGAIVVRDIKATGGASLHYDRNLANNAMTAGNFMMSAFTWKND